MEDKRFYAAKILKKGFNIHDFRAFKNEVDVLSKLGEKSSKVPRIIDCNFKGEYQKAGCPPFKICYYIMEVAENGELFGLIKHSSVMSEDLVRLLFTRILDGNIN